MRAKEPRRLAPGAAQRYVWAETPQPGSLRTLPIARARQPDRPPRPVTRAVTVKLVTCYGARRPGDTLPPVTVRTIYVQESSPPQGEDPGEWLRLTSLPVPDFPQACMVG